MALDLEALDPKDLRFDEFEIGGWQRLGEQYRDTLGPLTGPVATPLLEIAGARAGERLLDVGTGPGYIAAAAADAGLVARGCDISEPMLALARAARPDIPFDLADARDLPYDDASFDIVAEGFVLLHTALPQLVVAEAVRVLRPGGRLVASVYDVPARARFVGLFGDATSGITLTPPAMPPGPTLFDLSSPERLTALFTVAGLSDVRVQTLEFTHHVAGVEDMYDAFRLGTVRAGTLLAAQDPSTASQIVSALAGVLEPYRVGDGYDIPVSFLVASGERKS